ncbi:MAG: hypothetical protein OQL06_03245 [Gammaproteobacteria bacterium]|nr:hypothetical protein [Gammaproteobacteria bacterium]
MRKQLNKYVLMILLPVLAIAPLQGVFAAMDMVSMQAMVEMPMDKMHQETIQIGLESVSGASTQGCDQCEQHSCCENHSCNNGQCFSSSVMMLSNNDFEIKLCAQSDLTNYQSSVVVFLPSVLFRPPRV